VARSLDDFTAAVKRVRDRRVLRNFALGAGLGFIVGLLSGIVSRAQIPFKECAAQCPHGLEEVATDHCTCMQPPLDLE
jgi:hypothetical protein